MSRTKFDALAWAEEYLVFEESSTEIDEGQKIRLATLLEAAYALGQAQAEEKVK